MKKVLFSILLCLFITTINNVEAQVTAGSTNPPKHFSILEVDASTIKGGLRFPQLLKSERDTITVTGNPGAPGLSIYNKTDSVIEYWNGTRWVRSEAIEPWQVAGSSNKASLNTQNIYQMGNVGIGANNPTNRLHVSAPSNPLRLEGLVSGVSLDSLLVADASGVIRRRSVFGLRQDIVTPPSPVTQVFPGMIKFDVTTRTLMYYDGTQWVTIAANEYGGQNEGVVKINSYGNNTQPPFSFQDQKDLGVYQFVNYPVGSFSLAANTTSYWPENIPNPAVSDIIRTQGGNTTFIENPIIGQVHLWRIIGTFTNKSSGTGGTITIRLKSANAASTFDTQQYINCQTQATSATFTCNFITIADELSIPAPTGTAGANGYTIQVTSDVKLDLTINSITRVSQYKD